MRLQLTAIAAIAGAAVAPAAARAQADTGPATTVGLRVYADDDRVTVWSPSATATTPLPHQLTVDAAVTIDAVSAASIDVVSTASPYVFTETRVEGGAGVALAITSHQRLSARALLSDERDYAALRLGAGWRAELAARNTTVELTYTAGLDTVGRAGDPGFARDRREHRLAAALTQITDRRGYADLVIEGADQRGYLANPYRFVPIEVAGAPAYALAEQVPDQRTSLAALIRMRRVVAATGFVHADYRLSRDTWGITSHTITVRATRSLRADELLVGLEARGYRQGAASFQRAVYTDDGGAPAWRTRDHALGRMASMTAGAVADATLPRGGVHVAASAAWVRFWWLDDPRQSDRDALIASLALHVPL